MPLRLRNPNDFTNNDLRSVLGVGAAFVRDGFHAKRAGRECLAKCCDHCIQARNLNPARWSGATRDCSPAGPVTLNPEREPVAAAPLETINSQSLAA